MSGKRPRYFQANWSRACQLPIYNLPRPIYNLLFARPRSSSGPGHRPLTAETGVRLPYGVLIL